MSQKSERSPQMHGFGIVILSMILAVCLLVNMWLRVPVIAQVLGAAAYAIAIVVSLMAACIAALILDDEALVREEEALPPAEPVAAMVPVPVRRTGTPS